MRGDLLRPAGEAVTSGTREWRLVSVSPERLSEHTAESLIETHALNIGTNSRDLRSVSSDQRRGLVETGQCGAG
jgi:hypothetical protein